jgi:hypothetical protein
MYIFSSRTRTMKISQPDTIILEISASTLKDFGAEGVSCGKRLLSHLYLRFRESTGQCNRKSK